VAGCQEDSCQYISGIQKAMKRVAHVKKIFSEMNLEPERIEVFRLSAGRGQEFADAAHEMARRIAALGPISPE